MKLLCIEDRALNVNRSKTGVEVSLFSDTIVEKELLKKGDIYYGRLVPTLFREFPEDTHRWVIEHKSEMYFQCRFKPIVENINKNIRIL